MAASPETKLQVNFGKDRVPLINIYANDAAELEAALTSIQDLSTLINSTQEILSAFGTPTPAASTNALLAKELGAEQISTDKQCRHGNMTLKTGTNARGTWKGWMCAAPKGTPKELQCDPIWVKQFMRGPWLFEDPACAEVGGDFGFLRKQKILLN